MNDYQLVFDALDLAACVIERLPLREDKRRDYRYVAMNRAMQTMFHVRDLSGSTIRDNFPDEIEDWYDDYDRVLQTGQAARFERESAPQGVWLEMSVTRITQDRLLVLMQNVTQRRRDQDALRQSETRLRALVTATSNIVYRMSADWRAMYSLEGKNVLADTSNTRVSWLDDYIPDSDKAFVHAAIDEAIRTKSKFELEHRVKLADGTIGWTFSRAVPMLNASGDISEWFGAATDITQRKRAEDLAHRSEQQLKESDKRKDEFIAVLAHELRNPLAPIRTGIELLRLQADAPEALERVRTMMQRQVEHMVRLIDDLLDVSRITSGKIQLRREPAALRQMVDSAIEANRAAIRDKHLELVVEIPAECVLHVDPTRFTQVLSNLLHNATKFTDAPGSIRLMGTIEDKQLTLSVIDTGIGIAAEFLPRVFDLFAQGEKVSSQPGLGIGLALARSLVEMQDGSIAVHSDGPGRGTRLTVCMPVVDIASLPDIHESKRKTRIDCRVLVIDDNRDAANTLSMFVESMGGKCITAYDGESGVRDAVKHRPDVVLLDVGMPKMDGYDACRIIRRELGAGVCIVAVTGFGQHQDKERAKLAGFDDHLTKPFAPAMLEKILLQRSRLPA